jgi:predicted CoA-binding protein
LTSRGSHSDGRALRGARDFADRYTDRILRETKSILLIDWPEREVPDRLARLGLSVLAQEGPAKYVAYEVRDGGIATEDAGDGPRNVDLVYAFRPLDELPEIAALAARLGARAVWLETESSTLDDSDMALAQEIIGASRLDLITEPNIVHAFESRQA